MVDHGLVEDRQQLLRNCERRRVKTRAAAASKNDSPHDAPFNSIPSELRPFTVPSSGSRS
jgi:hypothetical protein